MPDVSDERRDKFHNYIQSELGPPKGIPEGSLLIGWIICTGWIDPTGERHSARAHAAELPGWAADGLAHHFLYADWDTDEEGDDSV